MINETGPRMSPAELTEACYRAAATSAASFVLGYGYVDAVVHDDGEGWPTTSSDVDTGLWPIGEGQPDCNRAYRDIATIYEVGGLASLKLRGLGSHRISLIDDSEGSAMLDDPKIWAAIVALAALIEDENAGDGFHSAMGMDGDEECSGVTPLKDAGLTPTYWADAGADAARARLLDMVAGGDAGRSRS